MGNSRSGRLTSLRPKVEDCPQLRIESLIRAGAVKYGERKTGRCHAATPDSLISLRLHFVFDARSDSSTFRLTYQLPDSKPATIEGSLYWTRVGQSGKRSWFGCPKCQQRRGVLYLPPGGSTLACRECHNLRYSTTVMTPRAKLERRAQLFYLRAGSKSLGREFTARPKGMRRSTFNRYMDRATELERQALALAPIPRLMVA